ncbi:hypothetical protein AMTRI_Chr02g259390 [Amborella trichopoda]
MGMACVCVGLRVCASVCAMRMYVCEGLTLMVK